MELKIKEGSSFGEKNQVLGLEKRNSSKAYFLINTITEGIDPDEFK